MSHFDDTAVFYEKYRPGIPDELARRLVEETNAGVPATTLLDIGTGTGKVVRALHSHFTDIIAVEPDAQMLKVAEEGLRAVIPAQTRLRFLCSRAEEFIPPIAWTASLVTICSAFHWMDQEKVLVRLAEYVSPGGVVAIFGDKSIWKADSPWKQAVKAVIQDFLGKERRAGSGVFSHHDRPFEDILRESPFDHVETFKVSVHRTWTSESILGLLYSTSFAARPLFGEQVLQFEEAIRFTLAQHSHNDVFHEDNEFSVNLGRKRQQKRTVIPFR